MENRSNDNRSEVERDSLLRSTLGYWSSGPRHDVEPDPMRWEEGSPDYSGLVHVAAVVLTTGLLMVMLWLLGV